jgi:hypothetical protein
LKDKCEDFMSSIKPTRELGLEEIFSLAWDLYTKHAKNIIPPYIILGLLTLIGEYIPALIQYRRTYGMVRLYIGIYEIVTSMLWWLIIAIIGLIIAGITIKYTGDVIEGVNPTLKSSLNYTVSRLGDIILSSIILAIILIVGFILLIIPGIIFGIMFILTMHVVVLERKGPIEALKRSKQLVHGRWITTFAILLIIFVIIFVTSSIPWWIGFILTLIVQPYIVTILTFLYYSMKARESQLPPPTISWV